MPLVGYKDIVCGSETSDFEDLGKYIEQGVIPNFGCPLPTCQFPLEPENSLQTYKPEWHTLTKHHTTLQRMMQKQAQKERIMEVISDSFVLGKKVLRRTRQSQEYLGFVRIKQSKQDDYNRACRLYH